MSRKKVGLGSLLIHTLLTVLTGGFWLVILLIWFLVANSKSK